MKAKSHNLTSAPRWIEAFLWLGGAVCLLLCLASVSRGIAARRFAAQIVASADDKQRSSAPGPSDTDSASPLTAAHPDSRSNPSIVGRVEIPALGLSTPLLAGDDAMSLSQGAGHIPGTALPGGLGTVGIAGHRDTHFRSLSRAAPGMEVLLKDRSGTYHYRVTSTEIVTPDEVSVLDIVSTPGLVLITCYPFRYIGPAPRRFIVHAALLSAASDEIK